MRRKHGIRVSMTFLAIILSGCLVALGSDTNHINDFVILSIVIFSAAFFFDISTLPAYKKYALPLAAGYLFRVALLFYDVYTDNPLHIPLVGGELVGDPQYFYLTAIRFMQGNTTSYGGFFPRFLGTIFSLTGVSRLWAEFIVLFFSILAIMAVARTVDGLSVPMAQKRRGVYLMSLLPNFAFMSAILRRETVIIFFVALSIHYFVNWLKNDGGNKAFLLAIVFALGASLFHGATGLIILGYIFLRFIYTPSKSSFSLSGRNIAGALVIFVGMLFIYARYGAVLFGKVEDKLSAGVLSSVRDAGGSSYAQYVGDA